MSYLERRLIAITLVEREDYTPLTPGNPSHPSLRLPCKLTHIVLVVYFIRMLQLRASILAQSCNCIDSHNGV